LPTFTSIEDAAETKFTSLKNYVDSIPTAYNNLKTDLDMYSKGYGALGTKLKNQLAPMKNLKGSMDAIVHGVTDPKTGLLVKFNCKFMRKEMDHTYDALCK